VAELRAQPGKDVVVLGSGQLVASLMRRNLVDEYVLLIHPLVLGSGRRLFTDLGPIRCSSAHRHQDDDHRRRDRDVPAGGNLKLEGSR